MKDEYEQSPIEERQISREKLINRLMNGSDQQEDNIIEKSVKFIRSEYNSTLTPKSILSTYSIHAHLEMPIYHTEELKPQRVFRTILEFNGQRYSTTTWEKNKQLAEQGSAIVCLLSIGIDPTRAKYGIKQIKTYLSTENKL